MNVNISRAETITTVWCKSWKLGYVRGYVLHKSNCKTHSVEIIEYFFPDNLRKINCNL